MAICRAQVYWGVTVIVRRVNIGLVVSQEHLKGTSRRDKSSLTTVQNIDLRKSCAEDQRTINTGKLVLKKTVFSAWATKLNTDLINKG